MGVKRTLKAGQAGKEEGTPPGGDSVRQEAFLPGAPPLPSAQILRQYLVQVAD